MFLVVTLDSWSWSLAVCCLLIEVRFPVKDPSFSLKCACVKVAKFATFTLALRYFYACRGVFGNLTSTSIQQTARDQLQEPGPPPGTSGHQHLRQLFLGDVYIRQFLRHQDNSYMSTVRDDEGLNEDDSDKKVPMEMNQGETGLLQYLWM